MTEPVDESDVTDTTDDDVMIGGRPPPEYASGLVGVVHRVEDIFLALLLGAMILLAPLQIFLRNFFDEGVTWGDPLLRVLVLWVGLLGAVSASRGDRHIGIDVFSRFVGDRFRLLLRVATSVFTVVVCALVAWYSGQFVAIEREYESVAFSGMPAWILQVVIPFAFSVMGLRYLAYAASDVMHLVRGEGPDA